MGIVYVDGYQNSGGGGGSQIVTVANYSALPAANTVPNKFYWCSATQGTKWLPFSLGGTFYNSGLYYSNGTTWEYQETPHQATQGEVNVGVDNTKFVTPLTFTNANKWNEKENVLTAGTNITIDRTNPLAPVISSSGGGGSETIVISASSPTVNDDSGDGYFIGQRWIDTVKSRIYILKDASLGAAKWEGLNFPPDFDYKSIKVVQTLSDFPSPVGNEIFLMDNTIYFIDNGDLDISGYTIVFAQRSQLNGFGQNISKISSTTAGTLLAPYVFFKSETNLFMNDLEIECKGNYQLIWEHIGNGTVPEGESFELNRFNILNEQVAGHGCQLGHVADIRQGFIGTFSCFNFENGFKLGGAWTGGFRVDNTIFIFCRGVFFGSDPLNPVTFARRFASNANITVPLGSIGYDFPSTAFSFSGQYQLQNGNATGLGTYVSNFASGFPAYDALANFQNNTGIQNTFPGGEWVVTTNTTIAVATQNVYYDFILPTIEKGLTWFSETTGQFLYLSDTPLDVQITLTVTLTGTANNLIEVQLIKEDSGMVITPLLSKIITLQGTLAQGRAESAVITTTTQLVFGDKIRVRGRNTSAAQNFTVSLDCNCIINAK